MSYFLIIPPTLYSSNKSEYLSICFSSIGMICNNIGCLSFQSSRNNSKDSKLSIHSPENNLNLNLNRLVGDNLVKILSILTQSNSSFVVTIINPFKHWQLI